IARGDDISVTSFLYTCRVGRTFGPVRSGVAHEVNGSFVYMAKIYVGNLPFTATDAEIRTLFAAHGTVESVTLPVDRETGRPRGFGFVEMSQADASRAIQNLNG